LLGFVALVSGALSAYEEPFGREPDWRSARLPRIDLPPDPSLIGVLAGENGSAQVTGAPGAAVDRRVRLVRVINLRTADEVVAPVRPDGSFEARLFAPPGSTLQINTSMMEMGDLPPEIEEPILSKGQIVLSEMTPPQREILGGMLTGNVSSSPGTLIPVPQERDDSSEWHPFVRKIGRNLWYFGRGRTSTRAALPGEPVQLEVELHVVFESERAARNAPREPPVIEPGFHILFDEKGRQRAHNRLSVSHLLTPTGLPIEAHDEIMAEPRPDGQLEWHPGGSGWPAPWWHEDPGEWQVEGRQASITQRLVLEVPAKLKPGHYGIAAWINLHGVGEQEYDAGEPAGSPWYMAYLRIGNPELPRLSCLLLGSAGTGGTRGTSARENRGHFGINFRNVTIPDKLIIPRDDAYTGQRIVYPLDPYVPMVSLTDRPAPVIPASLIPFDFTTSRLRVTVTTPDGATDTLGPAQLVSGQNDLSVLRPDYVVRDRIVPPVPPTYGNPSLADMYHITGRGAFDYKFEQYGHHAVELDGVIRDVMGTAYDISGTYDVYVAKPLDTMVHPEPGTPLQPYARYRPQVQVQPAMPAEVELLWRYYPYSDRERAVERTVTGKANRWGLFVPGPNEAPVTFDDPGEYVLDVTVSHRDDDGTLWMASRRGASVVVTPGSKVVVHGERGNRSNTARWRARWFVAGDNRFVAPSPEFPPGRPLRFEPRPPGHPPDEPWPPPEFYDEIHGIDLGHTCLPYESGDVAWLGHDMAFSLFPNVTFEDPEGIISDLIERRWPGVRRGEGRGGIWPRHLHPEDRRAIGEMPYVCMTSTGMSPTLSPQDVDQWGYFYTTSFRPGVGVRSHVAEDIVPASYWFFDDPYGYQFGNGPHGDLPGDFKMNYAGGVFRDESTGVTNYGAYASMVVLIDGRDRRGPRVLPPFNGVVPGSPRTGPLVVVDGRAWNSFLTFGAVGPGTVLEVGERLSLSGLVWPPVSGHVEGEIVSPSGKSTKYRIPSNSMGVFDYGGPEAFEPGVWTLRAESTSSGRTSAGVLSELVPERRLPMGDGIGVASPSFPVPVVPRDTEPIAFDLPPGTRATPPRPLVIRGHLPDGTVADTVNLIAKMPSAVMEQLELPVENGTFEYVYNPMDLRRFFSNLDTKIEMPTPYGEQAPAWFDTVTFTFWAGDGDALRAGMVLVQGEEVYAQASTGNPRPWSPMPGEVRRRRSEPQAPEPRPAQPNGAPHSSLLTLSPDGTALYAAHPWSGEVVRMDAADLGIRATARTGGEPRSIALSPDGKRVYVALADKRRIVALAAASLNEAARFDVPGRPRAVLPSSDGKGLFVADFDGDRIIRVSASGGRVEATSEYINRPACLALSPDGKELYTVSFRTGEIVVLDEECNELRRIPAPPQLNQCRALTVGPDGRLYAPQTRSDTAVGGRMFDRTVFPVIAVAEPESNYAYVGYFPDLLVVPPHRPVEVAVDAGAVYLASAGSDDVLAVERDTGFAKWHAERVGMEPGGIVLDSAKGRLYVLTITGQEIVALDAETGEVLDRRRFANDRTPPEIARGRYLFGTATDKRLTKDQWMSCAACHPDGDQDGRQWNFGNGPLDTVSLRGCLDTPPLHVTAHLDEIQDTYRFARMTMAGQWFVPLEEMHDYLGPSNVGRDPDLDALAAYIASLTPRQNPRPPAKSEPLVEKGRQVFFSDTPGCAECHPPPLYTDSGRRRADGAFVLYDVGTCLPSESELHKRLDTPSLLGLRRSEPYLHDGRAGTLEEVFTKFNRDDKHGRTSHLTESDIRALSEFLRYVEPP
jgi:DNA-binding beta-propeller fold protein YncE